MSIIKKLFQKKEKISKCGFDLYNVENIFIILKEEENIIQEIIDEIGKNYNKTDLKGTIRKSIEKINNKYYKEREGKSFILGIKEGERFYISHSGNCRFYLKREGETSLITSDFTVAYNMFNSGLVDFERLKDLKSANMLTGGLFLEEKINLNILDFAVKKGDILLFINWQGIVEDKIDKIIEEKIDIERGTYYYKKSW